MAQEIVEFVIATQRGIIRSESLFKRTLRGKDGSGYPFLSDEEISKIWTLYLAEVSE